MPLTKEEIGQIATRTADEVMERVSLEREERELRDHIIGGAMGEGAIPLYGRETRKELCSCCLIEPEGPNSPKNRMCTTSGAIGTLKDSEEREWCSEINIVSDGRCARARSIREAAKECKEKYPEDTTKFFRCYAPAFSSITKGSNPGKFNPREIAKYKDERVRVEEHIGDRVNIFIPSRQEEVWVKADSLEKLEPEKGSNPGTAQEELTPRGIKERTHPYRPPDDIPAKVYPVRASTGEGYTLFDMTEGVWFGRRSDTYQEAVERADKENRRLWEAYKAFHPQGSNPVPRVRSQGEWIYVKVGDTEMRGRPTPSGIDFEQVSPTYKQDELQKAVDTIEGMLKKGGSNPSTKEPWQMTQQEYIDDFLAKRKPTDKLLARTMTERLTMERQIHRNIVEQALTEGKPVPPEVLADYPELQKKSNPGYEQPPIIPMPREVRAFLRQIPTWRLEEAYNKLQTGKATSIEIVEQNRALAQAAIREILFERGKLSSV